MYAPSLLVALTLLGCQTASENPTVEKETVPVVTTKVGTRWKLVHERADGVAVRLGDTAHGIRIDLRPQGGVTPIAGGRSPERILGSALLELPYPPEQVQSLSVEEQGIDLVIRIAGPPLNTMTTDPAAPSDPVLTWIRVRDRGDTWRFAVEGIALWHLPSPIAVQHADRAGVIVSTEGWGSWLLTTNAAASRSSSADVWTFDPRPSIDAREPYPITSATWSDLRLSGSSPSSASPSLPPR